MREAVCLRDYDVGKEYMGTLHFLLSIYSDLKKYSKKKVVLLFFFLINGGKKASMGNGKFRLEAARCFYFLSKE